jgi:hypothetical protein
LKGTFDFGEHGSVLITKPVELAGTMEESDHRGKDEYWPTTIMGGGSGCDAWCSAAITIVNGTDGKVTIKEIAFEGPTLAAIWYQKGQDLEVSRVRVANVSPAITPFGSAGRFGLVAADTPPDPFDDIGGTIHVHDSQVDLSGTSGTSQGFPILVLYGMADVTIADNYTEDTGISNGVEVAHGSRSAAITGNQTVSGWFCAGSLGIYGPIYVANNTCEAPSGITVSSHSQDGAVVANNEIHLVGRAGIPGAGIRVGWPGNIFSGYQPGLLRNGIIRDNRITGTVQDRAGHRSILRTSQCS